jgi:hypothetical protein
MFLSSCKGYVAALFWCRGLLARDPELRSFADATPRVRLKARQEFMQSWLRLCRISNARPAVTQRRGPWAPRARGRLALFMDAKLDVAKL